MTELKTYKATVENLEDPLKKGKVQIRILPFMNDVKAEELPWYDLLTAGNPNQVKYDPPKEGSIIRVLPLSNSFRRGYVLSPDFIEGFFDYEKVESALGGISELSDSSYDNIRFYLMENDNIEFYNRLSGEQGVFHNTGSYTLFDSEGNVHIYTQSKEVNIYNDNNALTLKEDGTIEVGGTNTLTMYQNLNTQLQTLLQNINLELAKIATGIASAGGGYSPTSLTLDISTAETQKTLGS